MAFDMENEGVLLIEIEVWGFVVLEFLSKVIASVLFQKCNNKTSGSCYSH